MKPAALGLLALASIGAWAQPAPSLSLAQGSYTLTLPYLEFASATGKSAYSARLQSTTLDSFVLVPQSVKTASLLVAAAAAARLDPLSTGYRLTLPYLEFSSAGVTRAYAATLASQDLVSFQVDGASVREVALQPWQAAPSAASLSETNVQTVGARSFGSSSTLLVNWIAAAGVAVDHYEISATEARANTRVSLHTAGAATQASLTGLKAATVYSVVVKACQDSGCTRSSAAAAVAATTPAEYWQLMGSGNSVATLLQPVADGNARLSATRFGPEAGAVANTVQFYYGPKGVTGMAVAGSGPVSAGTPSSYLSFTSFASSSGLRSPTSATSGIQSIMTGQGVPLSAALGANVRLFFESNDADGRTRIYSVDSVDGYVGRDFNRSAAATTCTTSADYAGGGNCAARVVIGVEGDSVNPNPKLRAARQNKVAWPTLTDWRWDGAPGTFMVFTVDAIAGCTTNSHNHAYAVWNGSTFVVQYASDGCPKMFRGAQAALPMHVGGARYKMYYGEPALTAGRLQGSQLPFVGPKKLIYADGASTGDAAIVDYEDWEGVGEARDVHFLWPNGELLNSTAEGYIDDFHFLTPTGSLDLQVLYLSITDGTVVPFAAAAVLLNP